MQEPISFLCIKNEIPDCIYGYTIEENTLMIQLGSLFVESLRTNKIKIENREIETQLKELEGRLEFQKKHYECSLEERDANQETVIEKKTKERMFYKDTMIDDLKRLLQQKDAEILDYKNKNSTIEKDVLLQAKKIYENETQKNIEQFQRDLQRLSCETQKLFEMNNKKKSLVEIGDFDEFYIKDVANIAGKGDFHLFFKEFTALVDVKNGDTMVNNVMIEKTKSDLQNNDVLFAWIVSLNTDITKYNKYPIMFEWISEKKCVCYVNSLLKRGEPVEFLRLLYNFCKTLSHLVYKENIDENKFKEYEIKVGDIIKKLDKIVKDEGAIIQEMVKNIDLLKGSNQRTKDLLKELLNEKTNVMAENHFTANIQEMKNRDIVEKWCREHFQEEEGGEGSTVAIHLNDIWKQCKDECKVKRGELKDFLTVIYKDRVRTNKSSIEIVGFFIK
jgi:hypothetical protein